MTRTGSGREPQKMSSALTPREREVLFLVGLGHTDAEIGAMLDLSHRTINHHMNNVFNRMDVHTRTGAVMAAITRGMNLWQGVSMSD